MRPLELLLALLVAAQGPGRAALAILTEGGLLLGEEAADQGGARCARRVQRELDSMRRRGAASASASRSGGLALAHPVQTTIDLAGYALHQPLRSAPYDMYVTGMRVRVPAQSPWVRVERCQFDARNHSLDTRLLFRDLTVTGHVKLYENAVRPAGTCTMTLRLRRAGLGFTAVPAPAAAPAVGVGGGPAPGHGHGRRHGALGRRDGPAPLEVRTDARFVDPDFVSVYAHGCPAPGASLGPPLRASLGLGVGGNAGVQIEHRSDDNLHVLEDGGEPSQDLSHQALGPGPGHAVRAAEAVEAAEAAEAEPADRDEDADARDLSGEMEDVFLRGIRTLLARYMERRLQPALRDAVMAGMGYSVSYGR